MLLIITQVIASAGRAQSTAEPSQRTDVKSLSSDAEWLLYGYASGFHYSYHRFVAGYSAAAIKKEQQRFEQAQYGHETFNLKEATDKITQDVF